MMTEKDLEIREENGEVIIKLHHYLDAASIVKLRQIFSEYLEKEIKDFVLDFSDVNSVNSTGVGLLIASLKTIRMKQGSLKLVRLQESVRKIFEIMGADKIFDIE